MEETVSGVVFKGTWKKLVEKGKQISETLKESVDEDQLAAWDRWRPEEGEEMESEVRERSIEEASIEESKHEKEDKDVAAAAEEVMENVEEAVDHVNTGDLADAQRKSGEAASGVFHSIHRLARKAFRGLETFVYRHIISRVNPQYFDSDLISASLQRAGTRDEEGNTEYKLHVNINDGDVSDAFRDSMRRREEE